jgi:hypothetical protein
VEPGFLEGVVRFAQGAEHPVGHRPQVSTDLLEALCQPVVVFVHLGHIPSSRSVIVVTNQTQPM